MSAGGALAHTTVLAPIGFAEIDAWARLTRRRPQAWEVDLLRELDLAWLGVRGEEDEGDGTGRNGQA